MHDDLVDLVVRVRGLRTSAEVSASWPAIVRALERLRDRARALRPDRRRNPTVDDTLTWLWTSTFDVGVVTEAQRSELEPIVSELRSMVGARVVSWKIPDPPRRRGRPRTASA